MSTTNLSFALTTAGRNRALTNTGIDLPITHIQLGDGHDTPDGSETALASPKETALISAAARIATGQWRFGAIVLGSGLNYGVSEIGLWSGDPSVVGSTLVFYWSMLTGEHGIKAPGIDYNVETDIYFGSVVPGNITIVADTAFNALSMLAQHNAHPDPHIGYLKESAVQAITVNNFIFNDIPAQIDYINSIGNGNPITITSPTTYTSSVFKVILSSVPPNANGVFLRIFWNTTGGDDIQRNAYFRKNSSAAWVRRLGIDPMTDSIPGVIGDSVEAMQWVTFQLGIDTTDNSFEWYFAVNENEVIFDGNVFESLMVMYVDGFIVPTQVLAMAP